MQKQRELDQLIQSVAEAGEKLPVSERRNFLKNGLALLGATGACASSAITAGRPRSFPKTTA